MWHNMTSEQVTLYKIEEEKRELRQQKEKWEQFYYSKVKCMPYEKVTTPHSLTYRGQEHQTEKSTSISPMERKNGNQDHWGLGSNISLPGLIRDLNPFIRQVVGGNQGRLLLLLSDHST